MSQASIPVDMFNPGQVFASLGFLEAASVLGSSAMGGFDWSDDANARFVLNSEGDRNPFEVVLEFLASAEMRRIAPSGYEDPPSKKTRKREDPEEGDAVAKLEYSNCFPAREADRMALPIRLIHNRRCLDITHWSDGSSRDDFKLYAGNRSAASIARAMLIGTEKKSHKKHTAGELRTKGIHTLWQENPQNLAESPFDVLTPIGGSFNFDPRGAWTALEAGYSPNDQKHAVAASPVVELLAAFGLEHTRPVLHEEKGVVRVRYSTWSEQVSATLARPLLTGALFGVPLRNFVFTRAASGKNKIVTSAEEEIQS